MDKREGIVLDVRQNLFKVGDCFVKVSSEGVEKVIK